MGKLFPKSRQWYVLDERNCRLLSFKSRDAARQKQPDVEIDLKTGKPVGGGAAPNSGRVERSEQEIVAEIDRLGRTPPDWYDGPRASRW